MDRKPLNPERVNRDLWLCAWRLRGLAGELQREPEPQDVPGAAYALAGDVSRWLGAVGWAYRRAAASAPRNTSAHRRALRTAERFYSAARIVLRNGERQQWGNLPGLLGVAAARALIFNVPRSPAPPEWRGDAVYYFHK